MVGIHDDNRRWWILGAMSGVLGLIVLDETVVGVALATIRPDLAMSEVASHWVVNAYLLTFTCFVAIGGRLGDVLGHRGFFIFGILVFALASLAAGFAQNGAWIIAARGLQGVGAAIIFPACWAMTTRVFPEHQRGMSFGVMVTVAAIFMSSGPLVGGFFTETISWRWIFWINLPVLTPIALIVLAAWKEPASEPQAPAAEGPARIDYLGLVTLVAGLSALVIALMQGIEWGWLAPVILALFGAGFVLLALFTITETRTPLPLIDIELLRIRTFSGGNLVFFMFQYNKVAVFVFVALYLQEVLGESPIDAGLVMLVAVVPTLFTSFLAGKAADRFGSRRPLAVGLSLNGLGLILVGLATVYDNYALLFAPLVVWGATLPVIAVAARRALMNAVPKEQQGQASGVNLTIQMLGGTIGMAVSSTLLVATGHYEVVFLVTGALVFVTLVLAWLMIEQGDQ